MFVNQQQADGRYAGQVNPIEPIVYQRDRQQHPYHAEVADRGHPQGGCDGSDGGSFIPAFGDAMVRRYHVPIGVASTGQGATSVRQWLPQGARVRQEPTTGGMKPVGPGEWESNGVLFDRLLLRCALLGTKGFRAVLWHQGESDAGQARAGYPADRQITGELYVDKVLTDVIRQAPDHRGFLSGLVKLGTKVRPPLTFRGKLEGSIDIKKNGLVPIQNLARYYAFASRAGCTVFEVNNWRQGALK